jgi:hypothetical protein
MARRIFFFAVILLIPLLAIALTFPPFDGHGVKVYFSLKEVSRWNQDVNTTASSRLRRFV